MKHFEYSITLFDYNESDNTLTGNQSDLHINNYQQSFPNNKQQFFIRNLKSNNFRRFRLVKETINQIIFISEDNITCIINKTVNMFSAQGILTNYIKTIT